MGEVVRCSSSALTADGPAGGTADGTLGAPPLTTTTIDGTTVGGTTTGGTTTGGTTTNTTTVGGTTIGGTTIDGVTFEDCYARREPVELAGVNLNIIGLEDFKTNKRATGRLKDLADLESLKSDGAPGT